MFKILILSTLLFIIGIVLTFFGINIKFKVISITIPNYEFKVLQPGTYFKYVYEKFQILLARDVLFSKNITLSKSFTLLKNCNLTHLTIIINGKIKPFKLNIKFYNLTKILMNINVNVESLPRFTSMNITNIKIFTLTSKNYTIDSMCSILKNVITNCNLTIYGKNLRLGKNSYVIELKFNSKNINNVVSKISMNIYCSKKISYELKYPQIKVSKIIF